MTKQVLQWLRWFADDEWDKYNEAIADDNKQLAAELHEMYAKIRAEIEKEEKRRTLAYQKRHQGSYPMALENKVKGRITLSPEWDHDVTHDPMDDVMYVPDNMCSCGIQKHHYHCAKCGKVSQIG